jgi:hypothetical protein
MEQDVLRLSSITEDTTEKVAAQFVMVLKSVINKNFSVKKCILNIAGS